MKTRIAILLAAAMGAAMGAHAAGVSALEPKLPPPVVF